MMHSFLDHTKHVALVYYCLSIRWFSPSLSRRQRNHPYRAKKILCFLAIHDASDMFAILFPFVDTKSFSHSDQAMTDGVVGGVATASLYICRLPSVLCCVSSRDDVHFYCCCFVIAFDHTTLSLALSNMYG